MVRYGLFDRSNDLNSFQGVLWFLVSHRTKRHIENPVEAPAEDSQEIQLIVCLVLGRADRSIVACEASREDAAHWSVITEQVNNLLHVMTCVGAEEMAPKTSTPGCHAGGERGDIVTAVSTVRGYTSLAEARSPPGLLRSLSPSRASRASTRRRSSGASVCGPLSSADGRRDRR